METEALNKSIAKFYAEEVEKLSPEDEVSRSHVRKLVFRAFEEFFKLIFGQHTRERIEASGMRVFQTIKKHDMFPINIDFAERELLKDVDLVFANHQPSGIETLLFFTLVKGDFHTVMKEDFLTGNNYPPGIKQLYYHTLGRAFRKARTIPFRRVDHGEGVGEEEKKADREQKIIEESENVAQEVLNRLEKQNEGSLIYVEGTRSHDGAIRERLMEGYFQVWLDGYILPRMREKIAIKIGFVISDTYRTSQKKFEKMPPFYKKPLTMKASKYNSSTLENGLKSLDPTLEFKDTEKFQEGVDFFIQNVREHMIRELVGILEV